MVHTLKSSWVIEDARGSSSSSIAPSGARYATLIFCEWIFEASSVSGSDHYHKRTLSQQGGRKHSNPSHARTHDILALLFGRQERALDQELVLALGVQSRLFFHRLQHHCTREGTRSMRYSGRKMERGHTPCTSTVSFGSTLPEFGRTQYSYTNLSFIFKETRSRRRTLGAVVFTLNATG